MEALRRRLERKLAEDSSEPSVHDAIRDGRVLARVHASEAGSEDGERASARKDVLGDARFGVAARSFTLGRVGTINLHSFEAAAHTLGRALALRRRGVVGDTL